MPTTYLKALQARFSLQNLLLELRMRDVQTVFPAPRGGPPRRPARGRRGGVGERGGQFLSRLHPLEERRARRLRALGPGYLPHQGRGGVQLHGERLAHRRLRQRVAGQRGGRALRRGALRGGRRRPGQGGEGDVPGRLASGGAVLALELRGEAVQGAGPDVAGARRRVWHAGARGAALGRVSTN